MAWANVTTTTPQAFTEQTAVDMAAPAEAGAPLAGGVALTSESLEPLVAVGRPPRIYAEPGGLAENLQGGDSASGGGGNSRPNSGLLYPRRTG